MQVDQDVVLNEVLWIGYPSYMKMVEMRLIKEFSFG